MEGNDRNLSKSNRLAEGKGAGQGYLRRYSKLPQGRDLWSTIQMRRAAISIPSNIAEGKGRSTRMDYSHFVIQARGSLYELETQIELAVDLGYLLPDRAKPLLSQCDELGRILNGLIKSLE